MNDAQLQALQTLASKLSTTTEHLWGVLVAQAPISGATDLAILIAWIAGTVKWYRLVKDKTTPRARNPGEQGKPAEGEDDIEMVVWASVVLLGLCSVVATIVYLPNIVFAFANPEYWALQQLIKWGLS